jgi:hypothetical protein
MILKALEGRTIKEASKLLNCNHQTLRNRFPELIQDRKRSSPSFADDPETLKRILPYAMDMNWSLKQTAKETKISEITILRCLALHGVKWTHKTRPGRPRKTIREMLTRRAELTALAHQKQSHDYRGP